MSVMWLLVAGSSLRILVLLTIIGVAFWLALLELRRNRLARISEINAELLVAAAEWEASHFLDRSSRSIDCLVLDEGLRVALRILDLLDSAETIEFPLQLNRAGPSAQATNPNSGRWCCFPVADLALELPNVLTGQLYFGAMGHVKCLIANESEGVAGSGRRTFDVDVFNDAILPKDALQLVVRNVDLQVACEKCSRCQWILFGKNVLQVVGKLVLLVLGLLVRNSRSRDVWTRRVVMWSVRVVHWVVHRWSPRRHIFRV